MRTASLSRVKPELTLDGKDAVVVSMAGSDWGWIVMVVVLAPPITCQRANDLFSLSIIAFGNAIIVFAPRLDDKSAYLN